MRNFAESHKFITAAVLLAVFGFLVYGNALQNQMFWDDDDGILNNAYVKDWKYLPKYFSENLIAGAGLNSNYWRPLLLITYSIEWHLWKNWSPGYHLTNIILQIANSILLFYILKVLFGHRSIPFLISLVFLIHPLQTEAVTYVSGRADLLSFLFIFLGIIFYIKSKNEINKKSSLFYILTFLMFVLTLMIKERSLIFPVLLLSVDFWTWLKETKKSFSKFLKEEMLLLLPFILTAIGYLILRATFLNFDNTFNIYSESVYYSEHVSARFFTFLKILPAYMALMLLPLNLRMERSETIEVAKNFLEKDVLIGAALAVLLLIVLTIGFKKRKEYSFGLLWFGLTLLPASGIFIPVAGIMYEHYLYAPLIGFFIFVGFLWSDLKISAESRSDPEESSDLMSRSASGGKIQSLAKYNNFSPIGLKLLYEAPQTNPWRLSTHGQAYGLDREAKSRTEDRHSSTNKSVVFWCADKFFLAIFAGWLIFLGFQTIQRNKEWKDPITFYESTLKYAPKSVKIWNNLGMAYADKGDRERAEEMYKRAINLEPSSPVAYHNLANAYKTAGRTDLAIENFKTAIALDPKFIFSYNSLINLYLENKNYEEAQKVFENYLKYQK